MVNQKAGVVDLSKLYTYIKIYSEEPIGPNQQNMFQLVVRPRVSILKAESFQCNLSDSLWKGEFWQGLQQPFSSLPAWSPLLQMSAKFSVITAK